METRVTVISDINRQANEIAAMGKMLREGQLVAFPTETVYGVGANGFDDDACRKLYAVKNRPLDKPITELIADIEDLSLVADELTPVAKILAKAFMPGPVTLIVKKSRRVPYVITGGGETTGVRIPSCELTRAIIRAAGVPLATPSANISGNAAPTDATGVLAELSGKIPLIADGGKTSLATPSTVIDCVGDRPIILRKGAIAEDLIFRCAKQSR